MRLPFSQSIASTPGQGYALVVVVSCVAGLGLVLFPLKSAIAAALVVTLAVLWTMPRPEVVALVAFLIFQDTLQILAGGDTSLALYIKRSDEFVILAVALGCLCVARVRGAYATHLLFVPLLGCFAGVIISSLVRGVSLVPAGVDLVLFSKPFLILAIGFSLTPSDDTIERYLPWVSGLFVAVLSSAVFFLVFPDLQSAYLGSLFKNENRLGFDAASGIFVRSGTYSWFGVASFCLSYAAYLAYRRRLYLVFAALSALFVLLSLRRKSIIAVALVVVAPLVVSRLRGSRGRALLPVAVAVLLAVTVFAPFLQALTIQTLDEVGGGDPYSNARNALYFTSFRIASDHFPLGTGLASFGSHASRMYYSSVYREYGLSGMYGLSPQAPLFITDTFWPMVLGQGGVIALFSYVALLAILAARTLATLRSTELPRGTQFLALAGLFLLIGSFVESLASHFYGSSLPGALLFIPLGIFWRREMKRDRKV